MSHSFFFELVLFGAIALDLLFGDPRWLPHPVRLIGWLCEITESVCRKSFSSELTAGTVTVCIVIGVPGSLVYLLLSLVERYGGGAYFIVPMLLLYSLIAIKDLMVHSRRVYRRLAETPPHGDLDPARSAVSMLVGRDTRSLSAEQIIKACVESVSENMVDGITAPLFWAVIFSCGAPLAGLSPISCAAVGMVLYKAVNTMDSMFGYTNEKYIRFGRTAAKLDDLVNFIPARISGICIVAGALFLGTDARRSLSIFLRDRRKHPSPNSAHTEAALAGALGLQLGGSAQYFGSTVEKQTIGDGTRSPVARDILTTNHLIMISSSIFLILVLTVRQAVLLLAGA